MGWLRGPLIFLAGVAGFLMVTTFLITQPAEEPLLAQLHQQAPPIPLLDPQPALAPLPQQQQPQKRQEPPQPEQETQQPQQPQQPQQKDEGTSNTRILQPKHRVKSQVDTPLELEVLMTHLSTHKMERPTGNQVNMVVTWPYLLDLQREGVSEHEKTVRQSEFVDTVWRNLHHERVWSMHMMYEQDEHVIYLLRTLNALAVARGEGDRVAALLSSKLFLAKLPDGRTMQYKDAFEYANQHLEGLVAYIGNSDIYLGGGWEKLEMASMLAKRKIYSLSRHDNCTGSDPGCWHANAAVGGSDCFVLIPPISENLVTPMDHPTNYWGAENNVIYQLSRGGYEVTNPCDILVAYHNHCSGYRPNVASERVNYSGVGRGSGISRRVDHL